MVVTFLSSLKRGPPRLMKLNAKTWTLFQSILFYEILLNACSSHAQEKARWFATHGS